MNPMQTVISVKPLVSSAKRNDMMNDHDEAEFVEKVAASASTETPPNFEDIIAINRGEKEATEDEQLELEIGPNRCAAHHTA